MLPIPGSSRVAVQGPFSISASRPQMNAAARAHFERARAVGEGLDAWFSRELVAPYRDLILASNTARWDILLSVLTGEAAVKCKYDDVSGELRRILEGHGLQLKRDPEESDAEKVSVLRSSSSAPDPGRRHAALSAAALSEMRDLSFVLDTWVAAAVDRKDLVDRATARKHIMAAKLGGERDANLSLAVPLPDLGRFNIRVRGQERQPARELEPSSPRAASAGSHAAAAGTHDDRSRDDYLRQVERNLAEDIARIESSGAPIVQKLTSYNELIERAKLLANSQQDPGRRTAVLQVVDRALSPVMASLQAAASASASGASQATPASKIDG